MPIDELPSTEYLASIIPMSPSYSPGMQDYDTNNDNDVHYVYAKFE